MQFPPPEYSNYWLDLARREREEQNQSKGKGKNKQQALADIAAIIAGIGQAQIVPKKKP